MPTKTVYLQTIDRIEYDVTVQISVLHGWRLCMHAWTVESKPGMLRDACFIDVPVWTRIQFALQDGDFHSKKGVIQYGLWKGPYMFKPLPLKAILSDSITVMDFWIDTYEGPD